MNNQRGKTVLLVSLIVAVVLLIGASIFAVTSYSSAQNYKNNVNTLAAAQVKVAVDQNSAAKDKEFAEAQKSPVKTYAGPSAYGSIVLQYPKTWSAYIDESDQGSTPIDGYFNPNFVPGTDNNASYALRLQVTSDSYDSELQQYDGLVQEGSVTVKPYVLPSVKGVVGVRVEGKITDTNNGVMIIVPLRDKAVKLWTETNQYQGDFGQYILPNFKFSP